MNNNIIDFLNENKTKLQINVLDILPEDRFYKFNILNYGKEIISGLAILDLDTFIIDLNFEIIFNFDANHKTSTIENEEIKELTFLDVLHASIEITKFQTWDGEEYKEVNLSENLDFEIQKYFYKNIELI